MESKTETNEKERKQKKEEKKQWTDEHKKRERDQTSDELWEWSQIRVSILNSFTFLEIETFTTSMMDVLL